MNSNNKFKHLTVGSTPTHIHETKNDKQYKKIKSTQIITITRLNILINLNSSRTHSTINFLANHEPTVMHSPLKWIETIGEKWKQRRRQTTLRSNP